MPVRKTRRLRGIALGLSLAGGWPCAGWPCAGWPCVLAWLRGLRLLPGWLRGRLLWRLLRGKTQPGEGRECRRERQAAARKRKTCSENHGKHPRDSAGHTVSSHNITLPMRI